jgi:hypothetical protein
MKHYETHYGTRFTEAERRPKPSRWRAIGTFIVYAWAAFSAFDEILRWWNS